MAGSGPADPVLDRKVQILEDRIRFLRDHGGLTIEQYRKDVVVQYAIQRTLQLAVQSAIDMGARLISRRNWRKPADYGDVFRILQAESVVDQELADRLVELAGLRNVLVHVYDDLDDEEVFRHAKEAPDRLEAYARAVAAYTGRI